MKDMWFYNGLSRNLNFWDFVDMTEDYSIERAIKRYKDYRNVCSVNEHIVFNLIAAHLYNQWEFGLRKPREEQVKTGVNYLGGFSNINYLTESKMPHFIKKCIFPILKKNLHRKDYLKITEWAK